MWGRSNKLQVKTGKNGTRYSTILSDFTGPLLFVTLAEFSLGELSQPTKASIVMEVDPKCALLTNSRETIASKTFLGLNYIHGKATF